MSLSALIIAAALQAAPPQVLPAGASTDRPGRAISPQCPQLYANIRTLTLRFDEGSAELPEGAEAQLIDLFTPLAGNPMAEVEVSRYFPYGVPEGTDPAIILSHARFDAIEETAVRVGVSEDLVGGPSTAVGWQIVDGETKSVPYPPGQLETVDLVVKIKTECHPLVDVARRMNPYD